MSKSNINKNNLSFNNKNGKNILILISGSIAAYKTCFVISRLVQEGHEVQVATTPHTSHFIGTSTLEGLTGKTVLNETFTSQHAMDHIYLIRWADLILLCPATANIINKMAHGIADDLVSTLFLAHDFKKPFLVAPAMNTNMYLHPSTQESLDRLKKWGLRILQTEEGSLACGEVGAGRLMEPEDILEEIARALDIPQTQSNKNSFENKQKILITSGGTQEPIDAMRVLTNLSTGQTGALLAEFFCDQGFEVHYLGAHQAVQPKNSCLKTIFSSFHDLNEKLKNHLSTHDYAAVIHAAAVSDFHISKISNTEAQFNPTSSKISSHQKVTIELEPNFKILPLLKSYSQKEKPDSAQHNAKGSSAILSKKNLIEHHDDSPLVVGFKFTSTQNIDERAKAVNKIFNEGGVDVVVHNDRFDIKKEKGQHPFTLYFQDQKTSLADPLVLAQSLLQIIQQTIHQKNLSKKGRTP